MKQKIIRSWLYLTCVVFLGLLIASPVFAADPIITPEANVTFLSGISYRF